MMRVVFLDKLRETYTSVGGVVQIQNTAYKVNGRYTNMWLLILEDGSERTFKQKDFSIDRVEI